MALHVCNATAVGSTDGEGVHGRQLHRVIVVFGVELSSIIVVDEILTVACEEVLLGFPSSIRQIIALPFDEELGDGLLHLPYTSLRSWG